LAREIHEAGIEVDRTKFEVNEERTNRDALTGVLNRRFFEETLLAECKHAQAANGIVSLIVLDLDHFKLVNDNH